MPCTESSDSLEIGSDLIGGCEMISVKEQGTTRPRRTTPKHCGRRFLLRCHPRVPCSTKKSQVDYVADVRTDNFAVDHRRTSARNTRREAITVGARMIEGPDGL